MNTFHDSYLLLVRTNKIFTFVSSSKYYGSFCAFGLKENDKVEAMMLDMPEYQEIQCNQKLLGKMKNLRMILIKKEVGFLRSPTALPNTLRVLEWWGYPATSLPSNFHLKNLVILNLSHSYFGWDKPLEACKINDVKLI